MAAGASGGDGHPAVGPTPNPPPSAVTSPRRMPRAGAPTCEGGVCCGRTGAYGLSTLPRRVSAGPRPRKSCDPVGQGTPCHCACSSSNASRCRACGRRHPPPLFFRRAPPDAARHPPPRPPLNAQRAARPGRPLPPRSRQPPLRPAWRTGTGARAPRRPRRWRRPAAGVASHTNGQSQGALAGWLVLAVEGVSVGALPPRGAAGQRRGGRAPHCAEGVGDSRGRAARPSPPPRLSAARHGSQPPPLDAHGVAGGPAAARVVARHNLSRTSAPTRGRGLYPAGGPVRSSSKQRLGDGVGQRTSPWPSLAPNTSKNRNSQIPFTIAGRCGLRRGA